MYIQLETGRNGTNKQHWIIMVSVLGEDFRPI